MDMGKRPLAVAPVEAKQQVSDQSRSTVVRFTRKHVDKHRENPYAQIDDVVAVRISFSVLAFGHCL